MTTSVVTTPPPPSATETSRDVQVAPKRKSRKDPFIDNAKVVLIALVVCGHAWFPLIGDSPTVKAVYLTLYSFHMPAFILLSGYLSKSYTGRSDQQYRLITSLVVPYVVFSILFGVMRYWTEGDLNPSLLEPYFALWFLVALFLWRLTAPMWRLVRFPVLVATVVSLGASTMDLPGVLDIGRVLQFLPFFVAGLYLKREHFALLRRPLVRILATVGSVAIFVGMYFFGGEVDRNWTYLNQGAEQMDISTAESVLIRVAVLVLATVLTAGFLAWVPTKHLWFSTLGAATMYPFLLHGFFIKVTQDGYDLYDYSWMHTGFGALLVTALSVALAAVLISKPVRWMTKPIVEPNVEWTLKRPPSPHPRK